MLKGINKSDVRQQITQSIKNAEASGQITPEQAKLLAGRYYEKGANNTRIPGQPQQQATSVAKDNLATPEKPTLEIPKQQQPIGPEQTQKNPVAVQNELLKSIEQKQALASDTSLPHDNAKQPIIGNTNTRQLVLPKDSLSSKTKIQPNDEIVNTKTFEAKFTEISKSITKVCVLTIRGIESLIPSQK